MANGTKPAEPSEAVATIEWNTSYGVVRLSRDIVRAYFCPKATDGEIEHFIAVCRYHELNPWLKEAYLVKYSESEAAKIVFGKDSHARKAEEHPQYAGDQSGVILVIKAGDTLTIEEREGAFFIDGETLVGGWAKVYRKDRERPIYIRVRLAEYIQYAGTGQPNRFWKGSPGTMIRKVALSQARHEAFPSKFAGGISEEESRSGPTEIEINPLKPKTVAQAQAAADQVVAEIHGDPPSDGGLPPAEQDALAAEARARELAEAAASEAPPATPIASDPPAPNVGAPKTNGPSMQTYQGKNGTYTRPQIFGVATDAAKALSKPIGEFLKELTGKASMAGMDDPTVLGLVKKLGL